MKTISQDQFSEPANLDEVADQPIVVHHRNGGSATRIVIFVHGLGGSRYGKDSTWGSFPKFIFEDVSDLDVGIYQYETLWRRLKFGAQVPLDREADVFAGIIRDELASYRDIILVGHSMGGLLCKALITRLIHDGRMDLLERIAGLFLLASPQLGSLRVPRILSSFSPDADALKPHGPLLADIARTFEDHLLLDSNAVSYDKPVIPTFAVMGASDFWVDELSAGIGLSTRQKKMAVGTHTDVVKPRSKDSPVYCWVHDQVNNCLARFEHDVFLAMAMAGLDTEEQYQNYRSQALRIEKCLQDSCGFRSVFYAGRNLETKDKFEAEDFSLSRDIEALRRSKYFMLVYPEKIVSSVLFEAGLAVALGKPSVYFIRDRRSLPFLMKNAEQARLPAAVRIYEYESLSKLENLFQNRGEGLWKYIGDKEPKTLQLRRHLAEGRIKVDATIVHGAPEGWFLPGSGKAEWFKDHERGPEMVIVPAGKFIMGSSETEPERYDCPQHWVTIARPFAVSRHVVTRAQFAVFVNNTGYKTEGGAQVRPGNEWKTDPQASWQSPGFSQEDIHPVVCVSWRDSKAFAAWLSSQTGRDYRLLTEAEWEYAARAGTMTPFWWGSEIYPWQANYDCRSIYKGGGAEGEFGKQTAPVDNFFANPWGLYQVHGNVWEWCEDIWHNNYESAPSDGSAWLQGGDATQRVLRGGSWDCVPGYLRAAHRARAGNVMRGSDLGLRVGCTLTP